MAGLAEGYLMGLKYISGLQEMEQSQARFQWEQAAQRRAQDEHQQEQSILATVFRDVRDQRTQSDTIAADWQLASKYLQAGQRLMAVNPSDGIKLINEGQKLAGAADAKQLSKMEIEQMRDSYLGSIAGSIGDQSSLDEAKQKFARYGKTIPARYQTWNEETKAYFARQSMLGVSGQKQKELEIHMLQTQIRDRQEQERERNDEIKARATAAAETRKREALEWRKKQQGEGQEISAKGAAREFPMPKKAEEFAREIQILTEADETGNFKSLSPGKQQDAIGAVVRRARELYVQDFIAGEDLEPSKYIVQARQEILNGVEAPPSWLDKAKGVFSEKKTGSGDVRSSAVQAWGSYDPSQWDYRIDPDGVVARRRKQ